MDFFTADTHFGHNKIILYTRRLMFLSPEERDNYDNHMEFYPSIESVKAMDDALIENINETVGENDRLWHLGDFCFGPRRFKDREGSRILEIARNYRNRIKCKEVNLVWGNHDRYEIAAAFNRCYERYNLRVPGGPKKIVLSHYAQAVWDCSHHGAWHLYGHSHSTAEQWLDKNMPERRSIDVGIDNAVQVLGRYRPFSFDELEEMFDRRAGVSIDHHKNED